MTFTHARDRVRFTVDLDAAGLVGVHAHARRVLVQHLEQTAGNPEDWVLTETEEVPHA